MIPPPEAPPHLEMPPVVHFLWHAGGAILATGHCGRDVLELQEHPGAELAEIDPELATRLTDMRAWWWDGETPRPRELCPIIPNAGVFVADGRDELVLSGIPKGAVLRVTGAVSAGPVTVDDGELRLTTSRPGRLVVSLAPPPPWAPWQEAFDAE